MIYLIKNYYKLRILYKLRFSGLKLEEITYNINFNLKNKVYYFKIRSQTDRLN